MTGDRRQGTGDRVVAALLLLFLLPTFSTWAQPVSSFDEAQARTMSTSVSSDATDLDGEPSMRVSMQFQDVPILDVLKIFSQQTGINLATSEGIGDQKITLYFEDVEVLDALDQILTAAHLYYERALGSEIYIVKPKPTEEKITEDMVTKVYRLRYARLSSSPLNKSGATSVGVDDVLKELLSDGGQLVVDARTSSLIVTERPENFPRIETALAALDVKTPQIMIEAEVLETTMTKARDLGISWLASGEQIVSFTPGSSRKTRFPFGFLGREAPNTPTAFGLSTLDVSNAKWVLEALEQDSETKILARPKILTLDNESATIELTNNQAVSFSTTSAPLTQTNSVSAERVQTGVSLIVTPQVNDNGWITMVLEPKVTKTVKAAVAPPSGQGDVVDPKTRTVKTMVRVQQGQTLVLGGLIDRSDEEVVRRIPLLSSIPILGKAFIHRDVDKSTSELIIFVTPQILQEPETHVASVGSIAPRISRQNAMESTLNQLVE